MNEHLGVGRGQHLQTVNNKVVSASLASVWLEVQGVEVLQVGKGKDPSEGQKVVKYQNEKIVCCQQLQ